MLCLPCVPRYPDPRVLHAFLRASSATTPLPFAGNRPEWFPCPARAVALANGRALSSMRDSSTLDRVSAHPGCQSTISRPCVLVAFCDMAFRVMARTPTDMVPVRFSKLSSRGFRALGTPWPKKAYRAARRAVPDMPPVRFLCRLPNCPLAPAHALCIHGRMHSTCRGACVNREGTRA